jgi:hypothetical protein
MQAHTVEVKEPELVDVKEPELSLQERKAQLLRQGEFYRVGVVHAKAQLMHAARPDVMIHSAIDHAGFAVRKRVDGLLQPTGTSVASIAPLVMTVVGFLRRRKTGAASLGVSLALAGIGYFLKRRRRSGQDTDGAGPACRAGALNHPAATGLS